MNGLQRRGVRKEEIPMDQNILMNLDEAMKESLEKIFSSWRKKSISSPRMSCSSTTTPTSPEMFEELLEKPELD